MYMHRAGLTHATQQQIMQHVLKHNAPSTVPGSPAWFRRELQNLLAMVDTWGLPSFFLTLTADEHSPLKWTETTDMEQLLKSFCNSCSFENAPVECSAHFLKRIQDFLCEHILHENGILGDCKHYVIRYEVQHRGSLHALSFGLRLLMCLMLPLRSLLASLLFLAKPLRGSLPLMLGSV